MVVDVLSWNAQSPNGEEHFNWGDCAEVSDDDIQPWSADRAADTKGQDMPESSDIDERKDSNSTSTNAQSSSHHSAHHAPVPPTQTTKLFVGGLPSSATKDDLKRYFGQYGYLVDCVVMFDKDNRHRGFGFVTYAKTVEKDAVMAACNQHFINNKWVEVKECIPKHIMDGNKAQANNERHPEQNGYRGKPQQGQRGKGDGTDGTKRQYPANRIHKLSEEVAQSMRETDTYQSNGMGEIFNNMSDLREMQDKLVQKIHRLGQKPKYGQKMKHGDMQRQGHAEHYYVEQLEAQRQLELAEQQVMEAQRQMEFEHFEAQRMAGDFDRRVMNIETQFYDHYYAGAAMNASPMGGMTNMWMTASPLASMGPVANPFGDSPVGTPCILSPRD